MTEFAHLVAALRARGLDLDGLLGELEPSNDLRAVRALAAMSTSELVDLERLFRRRSHDVKGLMG